jgi:hypothetical protein
MIAYLLALLSPLPTLATPQPPPSGSPVNPETSLSNEYSDQIKTMRQTDTASGGEVSENSETPIIPEDEGEEPFTGEIVRGREGIPFPDPTMVVLEPTPTALPEIPEVVEPTPTPWQRPSRCETNETKRERYSENGSESEILWDKLFLSEDLVPMDSGEVYGANTDLFPYGPKSGEGVYIRMEMYRVPCVPYRIRMTKGSYYYDSGLNALKNYDTNSAGRGALHSWVEQKLFPTPPRKR